jgi:hypothetical protein
MAETLGSLCDKLTIVKLKQYHTENHERLSSLNLQEAQLVEEIDNYLDDAINNKISNDKLEFASNKVYKKEGNDVREITGKIGEVFSELASVNCELWHEQEKVYDFSSILPGDKDKVVKQLAILNLERNKCIDQINQTLKEAIVGNNIIS